MSAKGDKLSKRIEERYKSLESESENEADGFLLFMYLLMRKYADIPMHVKTFYDYDRQCQTFVAEFKS